MKLIDVSNPIQWYLWPAISDKVDVLLDEFVRGAIYNAVGDPRVNEIDGLMAWDALEVHENFRRRWFDPPGDIDEID